MSAVKPRPAQLRPVPPGRDLQRPQKEPLFEQIASFVSFFIYLLLIKSFFVPLFIIPTGSMAETLYGQHTTHTCPNCGVEYAVGLPLRPAFAEQSGSLVQCPNCRWEEFVDRGHEPTRPNPARGEVDGVVRGSLRSRAGDRIMVHGWPYDLGGRFGPQRWDVVVFKVPTDGQTNYIKRLIGKPGEKVEIIDGDIFINGQIARKTPHAQRSLWFPYFNQDHPARRPSAGGRFHPRWIALEADNGWSGLETRQPRFDGRGGRTGEIQFVTMPGPTREPGLTQDVYGYNGPFRAQTVTDVRVSSEVAVEGAAPDGFLELSVTKFADRFFARLYGNGRVTLEHGQDGGAQRDVWGQGQIPLADGPVELALSSVDYVVSVEVDGQPVIQSTADQYGITPEQARARSQREATPRLAITAHDVQATLSHLLIQRDVYYTSKLDPAGKFAGFGTQGHAMVLGPQDYFVLGDNSPASLDARFSFAQPGQDPVGPHLVDAAQRGAYQLGTVQADQLIGPAFLVYWPGTDALLPDEYLPKWLRLLNQLPGPGRIRWIH